MRRILRLSLFLSVLAAVFLASTAQAGLIGTGVVTADALRMRAEASTSAATVTYLENGASLQVYEDLGAWYRVSYDAYTGYVASEFVSYTPSEPEAQTGVITGSSVRFRAAASMDAYVLFELDKGATVTVLSGEGDWCQVCYNGQTGYVSTDYLVVGDASVSSGQKGIVTGDCVNVRSQPGTGAAIVSRVYRGALVDLGALSGGWYAVSCGGVSGYISADYVRPYDPSAAGALGEDIAATALSYLGTPYCYGGCSASGFDCSGFTMYIYSLFGYSLPHSATSQWNGSGTCIAREDLQSGDLVFFCDPSRSGGKACSHVGIYIGGGEFVHASSGSSGRMVRISSLSEDYYSGYYVGAKRLAA